MTIPEHQPTEDSIFEAITLALQHRLPLLELQTSSALRLFNGFYEGCPDLVIDLFGRTVVLSNHAKDPEQVRRLVTPIVDLVIATLPNVNTVLLKERFSQRRATRNGVIIAGSKPDAKVRELGVWYALDLTINQDASLYLDTRNVRQWALQNLANRTVLNTFAYTGSLGVAAAVAGAREVTHLERNARFLEVAKRSYSLNGLRIKKSNFLVTDFFSAIKHAKQSGKVYDCVFLDPPLYSQTPKGVIDLLANTRQVINKVRPLVADNGVIIAINNALYLSGADYLADLTNLCQDGYLAVESLIPVPDDITGYPETIQRRPPVDPGPFNHSTKIVVLRVKRK